MCPHCGVEAPIVYRGPLAYCTSCNKPRAPLSGTGVNIAGKPAKLGGTVASVLGWVVLAVMLGLAIILGAVFHALSPPVGWAIGGVTAALGIAAALVLLLGGRFLHRSGNKAEFNARREAVFALAQNQAGILRAEIAARSLGISPAEASAYLTDLSREPEAGVILEVDADGKFFYRFPALTPELPWPPPGGLAGALAGGFAPAGRVAAGSAPPATTPSYMGPDDAGRVRVKTEPGFGMPIDDAGEDALDESPETAAKRARSVI